MKRHILKVAAVGLIALTTSQQTDAADWWVGAAVGYSYNTLTADNSYAYDLKYKGRRGFTASIPVQVSLLDWLDLRSGLTYIQKNYRLDNTLGYNDFRYTNHYLQIPLTAQMSFGGPRLRGYLDLGAYLAYWTGSHRKGYTRTFMNESSTMSFDESYDFSPDDHRWDAGLLAGCGIEYKIGQCFAIFGEATYYYSTTSTQHRHGIASHPRYHNTIAPQLGLRMNLSRLFGKNSEETAE